MDGLLELILDVLQLVMEKDKYGADAGESDATKANRKVPWEQMLVTPPFWFR